jgi:two-component system response regulator AtoC
VDLPVLITGESGPGKEVVAQYIYNKSMRKGPFVKVNCAAIPSELLESELFGYERGAFTGAYRRKPGKFEAASGGFLFLDEISELPYPLQSKLLHVLQDGTVSTLGSTREVQVDVRIIVATNQDLEECVQRGSFRDDLFFRLNVVHINVPPLRERVKQLEILIDYFREKFARQYNTKPVHLDDDAKSFLFSYRWPGNIRELENTIRRATVLGGENLLGNINGLDRVNTDAPSDSTEPALINHSRTQLPYPEGNFNNSDGLEFTDQAGLALSEDLNLKEIAKEAALAAEREAIARVLQQTRWNRKKTAQILSVSYKTLLTKIKETGLDEN